MFLHVKNKIKIFVRMAVTLKGESYFENTYLLR